MAYTNFLRWIKEIFNDPWDDYFNTQKKCDEADDIEPLPLTYVPDHFKTQKMCDKAVREDAFSLQ